MNAAFASLENSLCVKRKSNGSIDGPGTADCIRDKLFKNGPDAYLNEAKNILEKARKLANEIVDLAVKSAEAADDAYTGKPSNTDKATAIAKSRSVRDEANSAKLKILKATKKEFAKNEAKEAAKKKLQAKLAAARATKADAPDPQISERKPLSPTVVSFSTSGKN